VTGACNSKLAYLVTLRGISVTALMGRVIIILVYTAKSVAMATESSILARIICPYSAAA
jgi:hypothetical protein